MIFFSVCDLWELRSQGYLERQLWSTIRSFHAEFMHDPLCLLPLGSSSLIEHQSLPHPNQQSFSGHWFILPCGLPVAWHGRPVGPLPGRVLQISKAEEVPLVAPNTCSSWSTETIYFSENWTVFISLSSLPSGLSESWYCLAEKMIWWTLMRDEFVSSLMEIVRDKASTPRLLWHQQWT